MRRSIPLVAVALGAAPPARRAAPAGWRAGGRRLAAGL